MTAKSEAESAAQMADDPIALVLERGVELHRSGLLDEAAAVYRDILTRASRNFDATHLLGVIALQQGRYEAAQQLIGAALEINPHDAAALGNLGFSYMRAGELEAAHQRFQAALRLQPDSSIALANAGTALHRLGRTQEAIPVLRKAYSLDPAAFDPCNSLGACLLNTGDVREAAQLFKTATEARPGNSEGWANLSVALNALGEHVEAAQCATRAVSLNPRSQTALGALGAANAGQGRLAEALESFRKAVALPAPSLEMLLTLGNLLLASGFHEEAIAQLERALQLDQNNLAIRWVIAIAHLKPIYNSESEIGESRQAFREAMGEVDSFYRRTAGLSFAFDAVGISQPFYLAYHPFNNRDLLRQYGNLCATWMSTLPTQTASRAGAVDAERGLGTAGRKIRLGVVSAHIHEHSVWNAITKGWVCNLDPKKFDMYFFQLGHRSDLETETARRVATAFVNQPRTLSAWVEAILDRDLDVLLYPEIGMDPLTLQLAALRLARVQAATWGHPETTGLPTMDLYISAAAFEPPHAQDNYSEKLIRLPNLGVHVEPLESSLSNLNLRSLKLPSNQTLLLCPGSPFKYLPIYDNVWIAIAKHLHRQPFKRSSGGRLVFFRSRSDTMDRQLETRLRTAFERQGIDFDAHVSIVPTLERSRFFGLMRESALMLDTLEFSGFNTAIQAIECDLPFLAFEGEFMRGRLASGIMRLLELPELVATTPQEFVQKAVELAGNAPLRKKLRKLILERRKLLFRDLGPVRALEDQLTDAVNRAQDAPP